MAKKPLKATDKRRSGAGDNVKFTVTDTDGAGPPLIDIFNDRRTNLGHGKRVA